MEGLRLYVNYRRICEKVGYIVFPLSCTVMFVGLNLKHRNAYSLRFGEIIPCTQLYSVIKNEMHPQLYLYKVI